MLDIFKSYLKNEEYYIIIYKNFIYIYNYLEIIKFTDVFIQLKLNKFILNIKGSDMLITRMEKKELLIKGNIAQVEKIYE